MKLTNWIKILPAFLAIAFVVPAQRTQAQTTTVAVPQPTQTVVPTPTKAPDGTPTYGAEYAYDQYMRLGYAATQRKDYPAALSYFRSALAERPTDRYATLAYWNITDYLKGQDPPPASAPAATNYDKYMRVGYEASKKGDYHTALINFQRALKQRPGDYYASQALRNVQTYVNRGQGLSRR
ncbi:hypothetical protein H6F50_13470 [Coleofasciculus sp. FACHB-712]|uniref:tetratricopeptide repeat protein n=1 Tax=Cyanophyceae TaxID=3028117 RepID=UPI0016847CFA|nr:MULTISPECIES: hypothetical protein [unclassified Coleofasciculus]MBD1943348.1 hypothetical protein [Coleofasciculus sp. FACHB-712]MBD2087066.1 hypothetical protein [Coleofasciculus sp. FACHB-542]MBD2539943.1 hypothetical protein [Coleofasciculus sp. FACHB-SPT36]